MRVDVDCFGLCLHAARLCSYANATVRPALSKKNLCAGLALSPLQTYSLSEFDQSPTFDKPAAVWVVDNTAI